MLVNVVLKNVLLDMVISTFTVKYMFECMTECYWSPKCVSFLFEEQTKVCHFRDRIYDGNLSSVSSKQDTNYYEYVTVFDTTYDPIIGCSYKIHTDVQTWNDARQVCQKEGGDLAMPKTALQRDFYMSLLYSGEFQEDVFIGADDQSGNWKWVDGTPVTNLNIIVTNPPVQHCLEFDATRKIYAEKCGTDQHPFLCEYC